MVISSATLHSNYEETEVTNTYKSEFIVQEGYKPAILCISMCGSSDVSIASEFKGTSIKEFESESVELSVDST